MTKILTPEEGREYLRLFGEYRRATNDAYEALKRFGMESKEFAAADAEAGKYWSQLRAMQGASGKHWMR